MLPNKQYIKHPILVFLAVFALLFCLNAGSTRAVNDKIPTSYIPKIAIANAGYSRSEYRLVEACGMKAYYLGDANADISKYDGLVVPGGGDVTPSLYKARRSPHTYGTNKKRDRLQIKLIKRFAKAKKPILGICGGHQHINVAFGGTLGQHIPGWHKGYRDAKIRKGSWLYKTYGSRHSFYNFHHQFVKRLAKGFIATQWDAQDGRIEAIEHRTLPIYGVQWHPDLMGSEGKKVGKLFRKECLKYRKVAKRK